MGNLLSSDDKNKKESNQNNQRGSQSSARSPTSGFDEAEDCLDPRYAYSTTARSSRTAGSSRSTVKTTTTLDLSKAITVERTELIFDANGSSKLLRLRCQTGWNLLEYRVQCSNFEEYRIPVPTGFLGKDKEFADVVIHRLRGFPSCDVITVQWIHLPSMAVRDHPNTRSTTFDEGPKISIQIRAAFNLSGNWNSSPQSYSTPSSSQTTTNSLNRVPSQTSKTSAYADTFRDPLGSSDSNPVTTQPDLSKALTFEPRQFSLSKSVGSKAKIELRGPINPKIEYRLHISNHVDYALNRKEGLIYFAGEDIEITRLCDKYPGNNEVVVEWIYFNNSTQHDIARWKNSCKVSIPIIDREIVYSKPSPSGSKYPPLKIRFSKPRHAVNSSADETTSTQASVVPRYPLKEINKSVEELSSRLSTVQIDPNRPGTKGVIVGRPTPTTSLVQSLPETGASEWLVIDAESKNIENPYDPLPHIQYFVKVFKYENRVFESDNLCKFNLHVKEYIIIEKPRPSEGEEVVAVAQFDVGWVSVVGLSFVEPSFVQWDNKVSVNQGDLAIGKINRLKDFFDSQMVNGIVSYVKNLDLEREYQKAVEKAKNNKNVVLPPKGPSRKSYLSEIRALNDKEKSLVNTYCRGSKDLQLDWARLYIRDPCIAISRLENYIKNKEAKEHTINVEGSTAIDRSGANAKIVLTVKLSEVEAKTCLKTQSTETWRVGSDLSVKHPELERLIQKTERTIEKKYEGGMLIEDITWNGTNATVRLRPHPRSYDLFDLIVRTKLSLSGMFTIGPSDDSKDTIAEVLFLHFDRFFKNKTLFNMWRGHGEMEFTPIANRELTYRLKDRTLDASQTQALRTAMSKDGFVCVEAPPGSGKTLLIAALVAASHELGPNGAMCVSATTNNAISNAIDIVHEHFPELKVVREYSKTSEGEISKKSKEISLMEMSLTAGMFVNLEKDTEMDNSVQQYYNCKKAMGKVEDMASGLKKLDELNMATYDLKKTFLTAYRPFLMGSTCELIARRGDPNAEKVLKSDDPEVQKKFGAGAITHLILDEASQLPPHLALTLYCALPALKKITLIGDSEQLGPYSPLDEKTAVHKMIRYGEIERLGHLRTTTKVHLRTVYRSHPRIVDLLLKPIYGPDLVAGLMAHSRPLAAQKDLPRAQDPHQSPVVFVSVENANCERGINEKEMNIVLDFLEQLRRKGVTGDDVAVVCNHRAQREAITSKLKGRGNIGILNTSVAIHTVDSFQGKEAKVVLVLTTKACSNPKYATRVFEFVANPNRGTVAVSRGQHAIYLFGDWKMLVRTEFWAKFVPGILQSKCMVNSNFENAHDTDYRKLSDAWATSQGIRMPGQFAHDGRKPSGQDGRGRRGKKPTRGGKRN